MAGISDLERDQRLSRLRRELAAERRISRQLQDRLDDHARQMLAYPLFTLAEVHAATDGLIDAKRLDANLIKQLRQRELRKGMDDARDPAQS